MRSGVHANFVKEREWKNVIGIFSLDSEGTMSKILIYIETTTTLQYFNPNKKKPFSFT